MTPELREACRHAAHVIHPDGTILRAGRASLFVLGKLGWPKTMWLFSQVPFIWGVEFGYWLVATNRAFVSRFFFRQQKAQERKEREQKQKNDPKNEA